jgi:hypothetical protein
MKMNAVVPLLLVAVAGFAARPVHAADAQCPTGEPSAARIEKPILFLDKSPVIVKYQLGRLSNEQLLLADRETTHPKFIPLW